MTLTEALERVAAGIRGIRMLAGMEKYCGQQVYTAVANVRAMHEAAVDAETSQPARQADGPPSACRGEEPK